MMLCRLALVQRRSLSRLLSSAAECPIAQRWPNLSVLSADQVAPQEPVQLAGRKYLPGSDKGGFPKYLSGPNQRILLAVQAQCPERLSIQQWAEYVRSFIDETLPESPAILIRGLPVRNEADISKLVSGLGYELMPYLGGTSTREAVDENLNTASEDPAIFSIEPHNEMSYSKVFPSKLIFSCSKPPLRQGESTLTDIRDVTRKLDPEMIRKLIEKGISYMSFLPTKAEGVYTAWQDRMLTEDKGEAEKSLTQMGYDFYWHTDGGLSYWYNMPAMMEDARTGEQLFFNQAGSAHSSYYKASPMFENQELPDDRYPCHARYADGTEIEDEVLQHIRSVSWDCSVGYKWEFGDIIILDNLYIQHGRMGFDGERRILATLIK